MSLTLVWNAEQSATPTRPRGSLLDIFDTFQHILAVLRAFYPHNHRNAPKTRRRSGLPLSMALGVKGGMKPRHASRTRDRRTVPSGCG
jgi:hypothetical protein